MSGYQSGLVGRVAPNQQRFRPPAWGAGRVLAGASPIHAGRIRELGLLAFSDGTMLGAGLEPASLSAYAPQTYVSASSTTRAFESEKLSADGNGWQVSSVFFSI